MNQFYEAPFGAGHDHVFLGEGHDSNGRKTWAVIALCSVMMIAEIVGGSLFGSLALVADGLHMSTHAGAMLIAALAYSYARKHVNNPRFVFGTGKMGDLAGFTSAIILAMIALLIGYEAISRFMSPVAISFTEAIPIAVLGLAVNIVSAWLLSGGDHGHHHGHSHHGHDHHDHHDHHEHDHHDHQHNEVDARDHNMRAAYVHVIADAAVSVLAIIGLLLARSFGWLWMDPLAGIIGALVIFSWSYTLIKDTGAILLDVNTNDAMGNKVKAVVKEAGDQLVDLHIWRLGPGHFGAVVSVLTNQAKREPAYYHALLKQHKGLSHITVEVQRTITAS
ncbi:CDF family Co(II)/Ni(II) efflux transporter DmeF [Solimicrobium silvestre]|uniref:CDF: cation diffusion facilitator family transporter n=1 Tax=Solimicrobium silvestre TaxID=2099400 RepID=A0A2S9H4S8_9BURK|nr:CDF family Co(II)/Ni(II) efflux transporter DmeF [Solimicrobium silvestre]PRC94943.1 CDF: cation diffusion facilitator family transporter [Solimicrobium silvestre]